MQGLVFLVRSTGLVIVDNQRSHGAKIAGFGSFDLKLDRCVTLHQNESCHNLTKRSEPRPHQSESEEATFYSARGSSSF
jgi:hypothetical protein